MGSRLTYAIACDGEDCKAVFFPEPRVEVWEEGRTGKRAEITTVPKAATQVRMEAAQAGWSHVFHPPHNGQGPGWYVDHCPVCTTKAWFDELGQDA